MLLLELLFLTIWQMLPGSHETLYQTNNSIIFCPSDHLTFICTDNDGPLIQWIITTPDGVQASFFLSNFLERVQHREFKFTTLRAELVFVNTSFYISSLTIAANLSSTIWCNYDEIVYIFENYSTNTIFIHPTDNTVQLSFLFTWKPYYSLETYNIFVSSCLANISGCQENATNINNQSWIPNTSDYLIYNFTIVLERCPQEISSTFIFECPLKVPDEYSVVYYEGTIYGNWMARVICYHSSRNYNQTHLLNCINGTWNSSDSICIMETNPTNDGFNFSTTSEKNYVKSTLNDEFMGHSTSIMEATKCSCTSFTALLSSVIGSFFSGLVCGLILLALCYIKIKKANKEFSNQVPESSTNSPSNTPIYEDIDLQNVKHIDVSQNVAYSRVRNTTTTTT